jgi:hypothetical protein
MAANEPRAPRVAREQTNFASASAALTRYPEPRQALRDFSIDGANPFTGSAPRELLCQANALLLLAAGSSDEAGVGGGLNPELVTSALTGISSLIALSIYLAGGDQ